MRFKYGDIDPGREAARVIVSQRYRQADTASVTVADYDVNTCAAPRDTADEVSVSASPEQLGNLANAIGRGDAISAGVIAVDIAAGATVTVVKESGNAVHVVIDTVRSAVCAVFRC
ncbi:hypothetical protein [Pseudomonas sp.]|uniref:hypothetical protein n=1 Tax=Pseudomonas sp. TaxID=306 RepID=UPI003D09DF77